MPAIKFENNPPSRYPDIPITESKNTWWIAKVKSRQEKAFANDLIERSIEYYLPYFTQISKRTDCNSLKKTLTPLFPSYVPFSCEKEPWSLLQLNRISTIIPVKAQIKFKLELNQIYEAVQKKITVTPMLEADLETGMEVKVVQGPLTGFTGEVINVRETDFLLLRVDGLGNACVNINLNSVIKCGC
jgi:transcription antitermination factor NusG